MKEHTIDPATGIRPIAEWGYECARGFVSADRFARPGEQVIKRANRTTQRKQRQLVAKLALSQDWKSKAAG
jgi:hypothetical protein